MSGGPRANLLRHVTSIVEWLPPRRKERHRRVRSLLEKQKGRGVRKAIIMQMSVSGKKEASQTEGSASFAAQFFLAEITNTPSSGKHLRTESFAARPRNRNFDTFDSSCALVFSCIAGYKHAISRLILPASGVLAHPRPCASQTGKTSRSRNEPLAGVLIAFPSSCRSAL